ncbi:S-layer homology domain-containing protein [Flavonifractor sp. An306]|uniref:S-layer homology domain-containing protein n=1 Tax=Flavonifractor sp. An306 TaxID=1965629 RepID=UPI000B3A38B3|nr:S-layer homology domain-containing protein [Flavonifractor sp. An306]OUO36119.1 hypothetical protein B5F88_14510 [Flavonifractor sp. An306]
MKKYRRFLGALLTALMLTGIVPSAYAVAPDDYGRVTLTTYDQTIVFDEAYTKNPVTMPEPDGRDLMLTPVVIKPDSHVTVTSDDSLVHVMVYTESNNSGVLEPSGLGGCQAKTGSVSQIFDYDWRGTSTQNMEVYFLIADESNGVWAYYWLQLGETSNAGTNNISASNTTSPNPSHESLSAEEAINLYDEKVHVAYIDTFDWPSSGSVLIQIAGKYSLSDLNGTTIPAGLIVDVYQYRGDTYTYLTGYDTTDGKSVTVSNASVDSDDIDSNTGNTGTSSPNNGSNSGSTNSGNTNYTHSYSDVQPGAWYYDAIMTMTENNVLAGYGNGNFGPNDIITDAQLETIMNRLVKRINSTASVDWANAKPLTRGEAAIYIVGVLQSDATSNVLSGELLELANETGIPVRTDPLMYNGQPYLNARLRGVWFRLFYQDGRRVSEVRHSATDFPDSEAILACANAYADENPDNFLASHDRLVEIAVEEICTAWNLGMFSGYDAAGTFGANDTITRAQLCQALYNMGFTAEDCILN